MEEGSFRMDANISVRPIGEKTLRPRIEIKNMNSFSFMEMAIEADVERQVKLYLNHPHRSYIDLIPPGTYRWDVAQKTAILMRPKESADDYRYFPEPDLAPVVLTDEYIDHLKNTLPELPFDRLQRYVSDLGLTEYAATTLIQEKVLSDYFEEALKVYNHPRLLCNWITIEFAGRFKDSGKTLLTIGIPAEHVAKLVGMIDTGKITGKIAKSVADDMVAAPGVDPEEIVKKNPDYQPTTDISSIEPIVDQVLAEHPELINDIKAGKDKAFGFLVGSVMKLTRGKASPQVVNDLIRKKIQ